jgi:hypothetical protein
MPKLGYVKQLAILVVVLILNACATSYQTTGLTGGYSESQLDENIFRVSFKGNGYTSPEKAADFTLLRSAELALEHGFHFFSIIDSDSYSKEATYTTPTTSTTTVNVYGSGNYAYATANTTTHGGQTYKFSKPRSTNTIVCFKEKPKNGFSYNANFIFESLAAKYRIVKK